jgi:hypothetical protein
LLNAPALSEQRIAEIEETRDGAPPSPDLYQNLNAFGLIVAAVYDRRWLTPALIETPLQVKTAR